MIYATKRDVETIREWINEEPDVAWIVKAAEVDGICHWKAVGDIDVVEEQTYDLWHVRSGPLFIPSGNRNVPDAIIADPFGGWSEKVKRVGATYPVFGGNPPGPYAFAFRETGGETAGSLARSDFMWRGDRYKSVGNPAHPDAKRWWNKLTRFVKKSAVPIRWTNLTNRKSPNAYVFPDAKAQLDQGRPRDINPRGK